MTRKSRKDNTVIVNPNTSSVQNNQVTQTLPDDQQQTLYQELKSSGSIDNPTEYIKVHLKSHDQ